MYLHFRSPLEFQFKPFKMKMNWGNYIDSLSLVAMDTYVFYPETSRTCIRMPPRHIHQIVSGEYFIFLLATEDTAPLPNVFESVVFYAASSHICVVSIRDAVIDLR
jgi:hypothetical protein